MKHTSKVLYALTFSTLVLFSSCENDTDSTPKEENLIPDKFSVEIPDAISYQTNLKSATSDTLFSGNDIYNHMANFIHLAEGAAEIVEEIMKSIVVHGIYKPMDITFLSEDDQRVKHLVVVNDVDFEGSKWQHQLSISDLESESNSDKGLALQVFWNNNPINGVAIFKPINIDKVKEANAGEVMFRIDYSEKDSNYDATMTVSISGWEENHADRFHIDNMKLFAGKKGDVVDLFGNSNHPEAYLFDTTDIGFNWAFVASANESNNIAVAEVGLPPSSLNSNSRSEILDDFSIKSVFAKQIAKVYNVSEDNPFIQLFLFDATPPAYFHSSGFVSGGTSPSDLYNNLESNIETLTPYNPSQISVLALSFKE